MPEGVEVRLMAEFLNTLNDYWIISYKIHSGRYKRHGEPKGFDIFKQKLPLHISKVVSKGKAIFFHLHDNDNHEYHIYNTLGMSGHWTLNDYKHNHIEFNLYHKITREFKTIYFNDVRCFGFLEFLKDSLSLSKKMKLWGQDIQNINTTESLFLEKCEKYKHYNITKFLMKQSIISGIGNYIKSEALYRSKLSPHNSMEFIPKHKLQELFHQLKSICKESYQIQSLSKKDNTYNQFTSFLKVYGKNKDPQGFYIVRETTKDNRTTHWVKEIQKHYES